MPQSYISAFYHIVFGTSERRSILREEVSERLYPYIGGVIRKDLGTPICINGMEDHIHILLAGRSTIALSDIAGKIKGNSSRWLNETFEWKQKFQWQEGFGGFTVSLRSLPDVRRYIENQKEHHRVVTWSEEWTELLRRHESFLKRMTAEEE